MTTQPPALRDDDLLIQRTFDAPLALVYRMWESRDHMIRWWGPEAFTVLEMEWSLQPGQPWRAMMASKKYGISRMDGVIREVKQNKQIAFTFAWSEDSGEPTETLITVTFTEKDGKTTQTFHQTPFATVASRDNHVGGWNSLINRQQHYAENLAIAAQKGITT